MTADEDGGTVDLLSSRIRGRVRAIRLSRMACGTALGLVLVAAAAAVFAEVARLDAMESRDAAERAAEAAIARDDWERRIAAEVAALGADLAALDARRGRLPAAAVLGAVVEAMPESDSLGWIRFEETAEGMSVTASLLTDRAGAERTVAGLRQRRPFEAVQADPDGSSFRLSFRVPTDRLFTVVAPSEGGSDAAH
jgi:hypothetical protein